MLERLDHEAPGSIGDEDALAAEVARLRARVRPEPAADITPARHVVPLEQWMARECAELPEHPATVPGEEFFSVGLPHTVVAPYIHLRHVITLTSDLGDLPLLHLDAVDYEAYVFVDGERRGTHRGYFAPFEVPLDGLEQGAHQVDVIARRAEDYYRWSGESEALNFGDAHGKGLGSVVGDAVTAGAGLLGRAWLESRPPVRIVGWHFTGDHHGDATVDVELEHGRDTEIAELDAEVLADRTPDTRGVGDLVQVASARASAPVGEDGRSLTTLSLRVPQVRPWTPVDPYLYLLRLRVRVAGHPVDLLQRPVGLRRVERTDDGSLLLNGLPLFLRGTTTIGCLWTAAWSGDEEAVLRHLLVVKALFGNTLRVHVHVLPELVYRCADRAGVLLYQDAPLQWHCFEPRKDNLTEELAQVGELARHVRNHPSVIVMSLTNEMHMGVPFHDADTAYVEQSADLTRRLVGPSAVLYQDWSGDTRPRVLPQAFHDYPGYFYHSTTAEDSVLDWAGEGSRAVISEYGGGAIPSWQAMRESRRSHLRRGENFPLPDTADGSWTAEEGLFAPTGEMVDSHQRLVGWQPSFQTYRDTTGAAQARLLTYQTGRMRRDRGRVTGAIQHYLRNPAPYFYNPWIDLHVIDSAGRLTAGFDALREAFRVVGLDVLGLPARGYAGAPLRAAVWCYNDLATDQEAKLHWRWVDDTGRVLDKGELASRLPADSSSRVHTIDLAAPAADAPDAGPSGVTCEVELHIDGRPWAVRRHRVAIQPAPAAVAGQVAVVGDLPGLRDLAGAWLGELTAFTGPDSAAVAVIATPETELDEELKGDLRAFVAAGGRAVLLERPPLESLDWLSPKSPAVVARAQVNETAAVDLSMVGTGMTTADLTRWATPDGRVVTNPLVTMDRRGTPVWARCGHRLQMAAIQEFTVGRGTFLVCQLHVWSTLGAEPMAARVLRHLIEAPYRPI